MHTKNQSSPMHRKWYAEKKCVICGMQSLPKFRTYCYLTVSPFLLSFS